MAKIASFQVDHTKLKPGFYVSAQYEMPKIGRIRTDKLLKAMESGKRPLSEVEIDALIEDNINWKTTTFDLWFVAPNSETDYPLEPAAMHTIEHLGAYYLRTKCRLQDWVLYFGPMGCRMGFYLVVFGDYDTDGWDEIVINMCRYILNYNGSIPGATREECGNYRDHNLKAAKEAVKKYLKVLTGDYPNRYEK